MERQQTLIIRRRSVRRPVRGFVLLIALIGLAVMTIAAAMLARSIMSGNQVAGNIALRQSVEQAMGLGLEMATRQLFEARDRLDHISDTTIQESNYLSLRWSKDGIPAIGSGSDCTGELCWYYPVELLAQDPRLPAALSACSIRDAGYQTNVPTGIPTCIPRGNREIDWFDDAKFPPFVNSTAYPNIPPGYSIRYMIDRQCAWRSSNDTTWNPSQGNPSEFTEGSIPKAEHVAAVRKFCRIAEVAGTTSESMKVEKMGDYPFEHDPNLGIPQVYYRISIQVIGPRATTHFAQAVVLI